MKKKTPQLRIVVTPYCNLECVHCRPGGEGYYENLQERMTREEINKIIKISVEIGFTHIKFTGGEPLLRHDIVRIIKDARQIREIQDIQLVTNGTMLACYATQLKSAGLNSITVSLDAAEEKAYEKIRGARLSTVIAGLQKCREAGLPVRINTVLMKSNLNQFELLMELATSVGASLKLIDLMDVQDNLSFWKREFYHFAELREVLEKRATYTDYEEAPGGVGSPLLEYILPDGLQVLLRDATEGTYYHDSCLTCINYPCQDALISLRVTHDGHLKRCLIRNDNLVNILTPLRNGDFDRVKELVQESFGILTNAKYYRNKWQPNFKLPQ